MSVVWRGVDEVLDRPVAVKVLASGYVHDTVFRDRMRREARAAARLCHPQVSTVYDFGEYADAAPYVVLELIDGPSLADEMQSGALPWRRAVTIGAQIAAGLAAAHTAGLVHRDVKPGNVMLGATGAKLVDFGISTEINEPADPAADGTVLGTPAYVAPERLKGGPALAASDVYALGVLLYKALAGRLPWDVDTKTEVLRAHLVTEPDPLPHLDGLPDEVAELWWHCLAKDPDVRPDARRIARIWARAVQNPLEEPTMALPGPVRRRARPLHAALRALVHRPQRLV
jgi:serine/threonine-protein kinase